jgi:hypothetical protein
MEVVEISKSIQVIAIDLSNGGGQHFVVLTQFKLVANLFTSD